MASSKGYLTYVLEQCPEGTTARAMMGEYVLYYREKVIGGIYDNRVLVKLTPSYYFLIKFFNQEDITFGAVDYDILIIKYQNPVS